MTTGTIDPGTMPTTGRHLARPTDPAPAIVTSGLTKQFGDVAALTDVTLSVPAGVVLGCLGPNGAGKTTMIRLLMGLLRPTSGRAAVVGRDAWSGRTAAHRDIGYLPGDFVADDRTTGRQYLTFLAHQRRRAGGTVAWPFVDELAERLALDLSRRWGTLSSGNRQKLGVVQAFMHRPRLLVLDEPTKGLDPLVQREFLGMVRDARADGQTVFLSSHDLSEVEQVADTVAMLRSGRLVVVEEVASLKAHAVRRVDLTFDGVVPEQALRAATGAREVSVRDHTAHVSVAGSLAPVVRVAAARGLADVVTWQPDLEEIFLAYYARDAG